MNNAGPLHTQVAAEAKVSPAVAMTACYLLGLSKQGKTLEQAAALLRMERGGVRDYARDWAIPFPDYQPATPLVLTWAKIKRGEWHLTDAARVIGVAARKETGGYHATLLHSFGKATEYAARPELAMRRLSVAIERASSTLLAVESLVIFADGGGREQLAPPIADADPLLWQRALGTLREGRG